MSRDALKSTCTEFNFPQKNKSFNEELKGSGKLLSNQSWIAVLKFREIMGPAQVGEPDEKDCGSTIDWWTIISIRRLEKWWTSTTIERQEAPNEAQQKPKVDIPKGNSSAFFKKRIKNKALDSL